MRQDPISMYQSLRHTYIMRTYVICRCQIAIRPKPSSAVPFAGFLSSQYFTSYGAPLHREKLGFASVQTRLWHE